MTHEDDAAAAKHFFSAYFHEDWAQDAPNPGAVVDAFVRDASDIDEVLCVVRGIERFMAREGPNDLLDRALGDELGCYYLPSADGKSVRQWLGELVVLLRHSAGAE